MSDENNEFAELAAAQDLAASHDLTPKKSHGVRTYSTLDIDIIRWLLIYLAMVFVLAGIGFCAALANMPQKFGISAEFINAWILLSIVGGILLPLPLLAIAMVLKAHRVQIRQLTQLAQSTEQLRLQLAVLESRLSAAAPAEPQRQNVSPAAGTVSPVPIAVESADASRMFELLTDIRDLLMMTDTQRQHRAARVWEQKKTRLVENFRELIHQEQWSAAAAAIDKVREALPGDAAADQLAAELSSRHTQRMQEDIDAARKQIEPLMSINSWDRARDLISQLENKYAAQPDVAALSSQVSKEYEIWRRDEFGRLVHEYKEAGDHRQWRRAYNIAIQLSERFADEKLVERIHLDMPTLLRNADIQDCQELVSQFKDLSQRHRYEEAHATAERVIDSFPDSMAAADLQKMLPKLQELIQQEKSRRQSSDGREI
jgi:tetratricopeptide (TPR) repeat protein